MGKGVPEWALREICKRAMCDYEDVFLQWPSGCSARLAVVEAARLLAAHEQPPVDWLRGVMQDVWDGARELQQSNKDLDSIDALAQALRARIPNIDQHAPAATDGE